MSFLSRLVNQWQASLSGSNNFFQKVVSDNMQIENDWLTNDWLDLQELLSAIENVTVEYSLFICDLC